MSEERMRLQKFLSQAEVCSRRKAEELISDGKVRVNGKIATLGQSVVAGDDVVQIGNKTIRLVAREPLVLMLNKPRGYLCTNLESIDAKTVFDLIPEEYSSRKLFCVGRLDKDSEGLLLITNDGELANKIIHPSSGIVKRYEVVLNREFDPALTPRLLKGAKLQNEKGEDEYLRFSNVIRFPDGKRLEIHLNQGRKREIRRLLELFGFFVKNLRRFQIGGLVMKKMPVGDCRKLSKKEIDKIFSSRGNRIGKAKLRGENASEPSKAFKRESRKFEQFKEREAVIAEKIRVRREVRRATRAEKLAAENTEAEVVPNNIPVASSAGISTCSTSAYIGAPREGQSRPRRLRDDCIAMKKRTRNAGIPADGTNVGGATSSTCGPKHTLSPVAPPLGASSPRTRGRACPQGAGSG